MKGDDQRTYSQRIWESYRELCQERQSIDVPIDALARRVGGSIAELHAFLRAECWAHRATPSTGEPAFAGDAARQSALCLSGEADRAPGKPQLFLLIKLIGQPPMTQQQPPAQEQPTPQTAALAPSLGRRFTQATTSDHRGPGIPVRCDFWRHRF
jgi:hypothetical protein